MDQTADRADQALVFQLGLENDLTPERLQSFSTAFLKVVRDQDVHCVAPSIRYIGPGFGNTAMDSCDLLLV